jgi:hypothetical protein
VVLSWEGPQRYATVAKAPHIGNARAPYVVDAEGLRDVAA